jgi:CHAD domain-containing protein
MKDASFLEKTGKARLSRFRICLEKASLHPGEKEIHDLRVSIRRLLSFSDVAASITGKEPFPARDRKRMKDLMRPLGKLRDAQVKILWLRKIAPAGDEGIYLYALSVRGDAERSANRVRDLLRDGGRTRIRPRKPTLAIPPASEQDLQERALAVLRKLEKSVESAREEARDEAHVEALHRMRLAFKKYRYSTEVLAPALPGVTAETMKRLHSFQTLLGDIHDLDVLLEEAGHFRRRVLEVKTESVLESRIREIRRREFIRLAPLLASAVDLSKRVFGTEFSTSLSRNKLGNSTWERGGHRRDRGSRTDPWKRDRRGDESVFRKACGSRRENR